jgi:HSP20 family protein
MVETELKPSSGEPGSKFPEKPIRINESWRSPLRAHLWRPPTDVYETEGEVIVRVEIVRGIRLEAPERRAYHQMEVFFGEFLSEVELPCAVIGDQVRAEYQAGFLRVVLPKERPQTIHIKKE